ncbi:YeeE/YedE family protein [uncultured Methylobacterium sp.]|uniref:YeeE/YedE family protein n=1 Tax=uncultured Methylobacterium sp. TaxID=157278 RepID=UPI00259143D0|nr:YeeE/YedE family protein [uncultured Methylobacterium sp.]
MTAARLLAALASGLLFGLGLALSGMMDPHRVLGFLDFAGAWDPSLAFVLAGAVGVSALGTLAMTRMARPILAPTFAVPTNRRVDARLIAGATVFGIGWGLAGFCPGPALAGLALGLPEAGVFAAAMLAGMALYRLVAEPTPGEARRETPAPDVPQQPGTVAPRR